MDLNGHGVVEMPQLSNSLKLIPLSSCLASGLKNTGENLFEWEEKKRKVFLYTAQKAKEPHLENCSAAIDPFSRY